MIAPEKIEELLAGAKALKDSMGAVKNLNGQVEKWGRTPSIQGYETRVRERVLNDLAMLRSCMDEIEEILK